MQRGRRALRRGRRERGYGRGHDPADVEGVVGMRRAGRTPCAAAAAASASAVLPNDPVPPETDHIVLADVVEIGAGRGTVPVRRRQHARQELDRALLTEIILSPAAESGNGRDGGDALRHIVCEFPAACKLLAEPFGEHRHRAGLQGTLWAGLARLAQHEERPQRLPRGVEPLLSHGDETHQEAERLAAPKLPHAHLEGLGPCRRRCPRVSCLQERPLRKDASHAAPPILLELLRGEHQRGERRARKRNHLGEDSVLPDGNLCALAVPAEQAEAPRSERLNQRGSPDRRVEEAAAADHGGERLEAARAPDVVLPSRGPRGRGKRVAPVPPTGTERRTPKSCRSLWERHRTAHRIPGTPERRGASVNLSSLTVGIFASRG
mmetsp:Transcript_16261/g.38543  ORF Transcript_16261/g.38543 Transcript_16261/m.38543 type:complete len:379 (-) Transcript_16261:1841-2977(-)